MSLEDPPRDYSLGSNDENSTETKPRKKPTIASELKSRIATQMETTTGHGCPNVVRTKYWPVRIMWIFLVFVALGASGYMVYRAIVAYLKYDVTTQISTVKEIPTQFPTVTICNINPLIHGNLTLRSYLESINKSQLIEPDYLDDQFNLDLFNSTDDEYYDYYDEEQFNQNNKSFIDTYNEIKQDFYNYIFTQLNDADKKSLGYGLDEMLITCLYNNRKCTTNDFNWYYSYDYGNCFSFNTGVNETNGKDVKMKEAKRPGIFCFSLKKIKVQIIIM